MRGRIVAFLAVFAFSFLFSAYWINSRPDEYYKPDGVWEEIEADEDGGGDYWRVVARPHESLQTKYSTRNPSVVHFKALQYEAEFGQGSIDTTIKVTGERHPVEVELTIRNLSEQRQTIRLKYSNLYAGSYDGSQFPMYSEGLCLPECPPPLEPANTLPTAKSVEETVRTRLFYGVGLGLLALFTHIGWLSIIYVLLPSKSAERVRDNFTRDNMAHSDTERYHSPAESSFRRKQDIEDLPKLIEEAQLRNARLREQEQHARAKTTEYEKLIHELETSVSKINKLKEKIDRQERSKGEPNV